MSRRLEYPKKYFGKQLTATKENVFFDLFPQWKGSLKFTLCD